MCAILRLLSEAEHVTEFRLRYGDLVIEIRNPTPHWAGAPGAAPAAGPQPDSDAACAPSAPGPD